VGRSCCAEWKNGSGVSWAEPTNQPGCAALGTHRPGWSIGAPPCPAPPRRHSSTEGRRRRCPHSPDATGGTHRVFSMVLRRREERDAGAVRSGAVPAGGDSACWADVLGGVDTGWGCGVLPDGGRSWGKPSGGQGAQSRGFYLQGTHDLAYGINFLGDCSRWIWLASMWLDFFFAAIVHRQLGTFDFDSFRLSVWRDWVWRVQVERYYCFLLC
jgi:hypothetical protein